MPKDQFKTRLEIAKKKILKKNHHNKDDNPSSIGTAFKLSTELVAAVAVGTIIGFIFDQTFGTRPWFILIFFFCWSGCRNNKCNQVCKKYAKVDKNLWQQIQ